MLRLVLLALLIWGTLRLAGRWLGQVLSSGQGGRFDRPKGGRGTASGPPAKAGMLSRCPRCGVHFAEGAEGSRGGYCSEYCREAATGASP